MTFARDLWLRIETIHAVIYFDPAGIDAAKAVGVEGFWRGYFGYRAAPMGPVSPGVVEATFFNFAPSFVARWVPAVWDLATPATLLGARLDAAATALRRHPAGVIEQAVAATAALRAGCDAAVAAGRPLFAANRHLTLPDDPVAALWQLCTNLREHRGDGHVAALTAAGLDGLMAHVLIALEQGNSPDDLQRARGWTADDWAAALTRCRALGLVNDGGVLTDPGRHLRADVEAVTDRLAAAPFASFDDGRRAGLLADLDPLARAIGAAGVIRYPNPMGLPPLAG